MNCSSLPSSFVPSLASTLPSSLASTFPSSLASNSSRCAVAAPWSQACAEAQVGRILDQSEVRKEAPHHTRTVVGRHPRRRRSPAGRHWPVARRPPARATTGNAVEQRRDVVANDDGRDGRCSVPVPCSCRPFKRHSSAYWTRLAVARVDVGDDDLHSGGDGRGHAGPPVKWCRGRHRGQLKVSPGRGVRYRVRHGA